MRTSAKSSLALHILLSLSALCGCFTPFEVECGEDAHCNRFPGGLCHTNPQTERRWCSYPDAACATGYRYSDLDVGDGVSAACTGEPPARCNPHADFGEPMLVANLSSSLDESWMSMTPDELTVYLMRVGNGSLITLMSARSSTTEALPPPTPGLTTAMITSAAGMESLPSPTADGLLVYYHRQVPGDEVRMFVSMRTARSDAFDEGSPVFVGGTAIAALNPVIASNGQTLYWLDYSQLALHASIRQYRHDSFGEPIAMTTFVLFHWALSADELTLYYSTGLSTADVYVSTRTSKAVPFEIGVPVSNVNSTEADMPQLLTADNCWLYLASRRSGGFGGSDIWVARRPR